MRDLTELGIPLVGNELVFHTTVMDPLINETQTGNAYSLVYNSTVKMRFLGGQPQIFKPNMPFKAYVSDKTLYQKSSKNISKKNYMIMLLKD